MRHAVVTGGGTGIGLAVARRLRADGDEVTIVGRRRDVLEGASGGAFRVEVADLREPDEVQALVDRLGVVDVLVLNAGGTATRHDDGIAGAAAMWLDDFRLNVLTTVLLAEALLPRMSRPGGRIVAMSSVAALRGAGSYGAAKAAVSAWVTGTAAAVAKDGITVNAVAPGFVPETEFWAGRLTDELVAGRLAGIPAGRPGTVEEVAEAVAYLTSPRAGWTTGQVLAVHGGSVLARL
ncbi:SDR family NAD(P)-dependent oxidoreductase [Cellulomonas edaphi]|uniref:SDR family oxidoreductase n=1 Tax=Cellulomonas edaphi TaxID=3053468 RepID=A0ABT7S2Q5_9CELL|nr:SDR family oxidoreductase [Cellulomons edaphi]MDM7829896.1 SDR family oxidoreductase [Cellulomons edaphi]